MCKSIGTGPNSVTSGDQKHPGAPLSGAPGASRDNSVHEKRVSEKDSSIPRFRVITYKGKEVILPDCKDFRAGIDMLAKVVGGADLPFVQDLMSQVANAAIRNEKVDEQILSFIMSTLIRARPKNQFQAMLVVQSACAHVAAMEIAGNLANAVTLELFDSYQRAFNKLTRTFVMQMAALQHLQLEGDQLPIVRTVTQNPANKTSRAVETDDTRSKNIANARGRANGTRVVHESDAQHENSSPA